MHCSKKYSQLVKLLHSIWKVKTLYKHSPFSLAGLILKYLRPPCVWEEIWESKEFGWEQLFMHCKHNVFISSLSWICIVSQLISRALSIYCKQFQESNNKLGRFSIVRIFKTPSPLATELCHNKKKTFFVRVLSRIRSIYCNPICFR